MKLRNKKTGKVIEALISAYGISGDVAISVMDSNSESGYTDLGRYKTLAELNAEWEDYKPKESSKYYLINEETGYIINFDNENQMKLFIHECDGWRQVKVFLDGKEYFIDKISGKVKNEGK